MIVNEVIVNKNKLKKNIKPVDLKSNMKNKKLALNNYLLKYAPISYRSDFRIYRGIESNKKIFQLDSSKIERIAGHAKNYHTLLMDYILPEWSNYPDRSRSFICATDEGTAASYGNLYRVYPIGNPLIGICHFSDLWESFRNFEVQDTHDFFNWLGKSIGYKFIDDLSSIKKGLKIADKQWPKLKIDYKKYLKGKEEEDYNYYNYGTTTRKTAGSSKLNAFENAIEFFESESLKFNSVTDLLRYNFNPKRNNFKLAKLSQCSDTGDDNEIWFSGPAIFVNDEYVRDLTNDNYGYY